MAAPQTAVGVTTIPVGGAQPCQVTVGLGALSALAGALGDGVRQVLVMHAAVQADRVTEAVNASAAEGFVGRRCKRRTARSRRPPMAANAWEQ